MTLYGLAARNLLRSKLRSAFTLLAVAIGVLTFTLLQTVQTAWTSVANGAPKDRFITRHGTSFAMTLPVKYAQEVRQIPHVRSATFVNWFGGRTPAHPEEFFPTLAVDPTTYFDVYSELEVSPEAKRAWAEQRDAAIVGDALAAKLGWKVGDKVALESGFYHELPTWEFQIVGTYSCRQRSADRFTMILRWDYFNERVGSWHNNRIGWAVSRAEKGVASAEIVDAIDRHFADGDTPTVTQDEGTFDASFGEGMSALLRAFDLVCLAVLGALGLLVGNTIAMAVRERTREYATLGALGFVPTRLAGLVVGEAIVLVLLGSAVGLLMAQGVVAGAVGPWVEANLGAYLPYFRITPMTVALANVAALAVAVGGAAVPTYGISRLKIVDALKHVG